MAKRGAELISPSLLANIPKRSKECHEQLLLDIGEWNESSNKSSTQSEAPNSNPPNKKLKLSLPKEDQWQFVDEAKEAASEKLRTQKYRYKHEMGCVELCCVARWPKHSLLQ